MLNNPLVVLIEKVVTFKIAADTLIYEALQCELSLECDKKHYTKEDLENYMRDLVVLRRMLRNARIAFDAYHEAQQIFKEVTHADPEAPLIDTVLIQHIDEIDATLQTLLR